MGTIIIVFGVAMWCLPRLENSMDRVFCGREIAKHNIRVWSIVSVITTIIGIALSVIQP